MWKIGGKRAFLVDDDTGNITLVQGDSGTLVLEGIDTDNNYKIYFSFYNSNRRILGNELFVESNYSSTVMFDIPSSLTDLLTVKPREEYAEYYYGVKQCLEAETEDDVDYEDTLCVGNNDIGDLNLVIVYPKKVEGI